MKNCLKIAFLLFSAVFMMSSCSDDDNANTGLVPDGENFGKANEVFTADDWYPGGELGTTRKASYSAPAPAVTGVAGMEESFIRGEDFFENVYTFSEEPRKGLGPVWVRNSCIKCHPGYGHGKRRDAYLANEGGNGYLLVVYHPTATTTSDGVRYTTSASGYISEVTGMPQTKAMAPFKAPIDESQITIEWKKVTTMPSGLAMTFPDGEAYELIYPEVSIPQSAFNTNPKPENYEVRLESTIGIYGTGLIDAITEEDMLAEYKKQAASVRSRDKAVSDYLNPAIFDGTTDTWANSAWYNLADGQKRVKKFTYAMTRASLQDGAGANAIWNITNVTRSDRRYLYTTPAWAKAMSEDDAVLDYIATNGAAVSSPVHPYWADTKEGIAEKVNTLLSMNTAAKGGDNYTNAFGDPEMTDKQYYDFMVWHRGLAVPAARDLDNIEVQRGKKVFQQIGCESCHRASWTTGIDNYWVDNSIKAYCNANGVVANNSLPRFANQTIHPYTDMVQHRLFMENDIRTGWCRTTPLWGRGLSLQLTGAEDRLHDCRARNEIEAIMWHAYSKDSHAYWSAVQFYNLPKADRDAIVKFLRSI